MGLAEETEGLDTEAEGLGEEAGDVEETAAVEEEVASIEEAELGAVDGGSYDQVSGVYDIMRQVRRNIANRARKAPRRAQHRIARNITRAVVHRTSKANRIVPLEALDVKPGASVTFTYEAPEPCRFLGMSIGAVVISTFGGTDLKFGTDRLCEASGVSGGSGEGGAFSLSIFDPLSRKGLIIGRGRIIGNNSAKWTFTIRASAKNPGPADFLATLELFQLGKSCR